MYDDIEPIDGFHSIEHDELGAFRWTQGSFRFRPRRPARFARLVTCYYGDDGSLSVDSPAGPVDRVELCRGWHACVLRVNAQAGEVIDCRIAPVIDVPNETRELGIMLRTFELFDDEARFLRLRGVPDNLRLNQREIRRGQSVLASRPPALRVNLETRCNIPETSQACTYCAWDWAKESERGSPAITLDWFDELGEFYSRAVEVNDCSIGEPTMHKQFGAIVARLDADGKRVSMTTNGQLLTPRLRHDVLGKNLSLYVSIDAATAAGYTRYRNDRFADVIANLTALCREKKAHGGLPRVYASFIAMRSNVAELPRFFALMREVGVDEVKLRSLYLDDNLAPVTINNGYRFDYAAEVLSAGELAEAERLARESAYKQQVALHVEWEQFARDVGDGGSPVCNEPWRTMYVLRRGIMPCCYATEPIARWSERQGRSLDTFLQDVFNGPAYQEIRAELAAGRLSDYCRNTPSCPILKDMQAKGQAAAGKNIYQIRALAAPGVDDERSWPMVPLSALTCGREAA